MGIMRSLGGIITDVINRATHNSRWQADIIYVLVNIILRKALARQHIAGNITYFSGLAVDHGIYNLVRIGWKARIHTQEDLHFVSPYTQAGIIQVIHGLD